MAPSTLALSLYNALAAHFPRGGTLGQIAMTVANAGGTPMSAAEAKKAAQGLLDRGLIAKKGRTITLRDPLRRVCQHRDRTGDGWSGWIVFDRFGRVTPLTDAKGKGAFKC